MRLQASLLALSLIVAAQSDCPAEPPTPTPVPDCVDQAIHATYEACVQATDEPSCVAAGGTWTYVGIAPFEQCLCPTGEENCVCTSSDMCSSLCIAPIDDTMCQDVTEGNCAPYSPTVGCYCLFGSDGTASAICID